jgi:hypothetical protein
MDQTTDKRALAKPVIGVAAAVVVIAAGAWFYLRGRDTPPPPAAAAPEPALEAPAAPDRIEHPVPPAAGGDTPKSALPELADSDKAVQDALVGAVPGLSAGQILVPESLIRHIVVSIDNLPRQKISVDKRPLTPAAGVLLVEGDELHATLDSRNFARYEPLMELLRKTDMQRLAGVYLHFYPLFQKAYQDLGYPTGYFNDRLVKVIDLLLATPQVAGPIELVRPNVLYEFADPALEALPAGQKILIRIGPDNAAAVKAKLMELRAIVTAAAPKE